jgi:hypothetical protein
MSEVVDLFKNKQIPECPVEVVRAPLSFCEHEKILMHEQSRTISCAKCNQVFDPYDFLKRDAHRIVRAWQLHRQVTHEVEEKNKVVEELKKQVARLRQFIKRHSDKDSEAVKVK